MLNKCEQIKEEVKGVLLKAANGEVATTEVSLSEN